MGRLGSDHKIIRIGKDFSITEFIVPELPSSNPYIGDVSYDGIYYLKSGGTVYHSIDLDPNSANYGRYIQSHTLSKTLSIHDWAFNAVDGMMYTVEKKTNHLFKIDAPTGNVTDLGEVPILAGLNYTYGAVYFDVDGNFYVSANQTGSIYKIDNVQLASFGNINSNIFAFGPSSSSNDGARCPTAPVPQEDCINGVDDDGDGLVDCDDPACSGVASCPVIEVSGGDDGGLESNDRLSSLIIERNYQRTKSHHQFDPTKASLFRAPGTKKTFKYARSHSDLTLEEFIPQNAIADATLLESTPNDLLAITNAVDVLSVDYYQGDFRAGAILALRTEQAVYEHSKFICDRLLGAELLSVSTMDINEHQFLKSIVKRPDGSLEFVLSFAAGIEPEGLHIESHWNIDRYTANRDYYNFQIWAGSIDDLYNMALEIIELVESKAPVLTYQSSEAPSVFVKSATYENGTLGLEILNNGQVEAVQLTGGLKRTETQQEESITFDADIQGYITEVEVPVGALFDLGFRLSHGAGTPDDLFISDGPWGVDSSAPSTQLIEFQVSQNNGLYDGAGYRLERNVKLSATTDEYVSVYKSFNPRSSVVDLSQYNTFSFEAAGSGRLEVTLVKGAVELWEDQPRATLELSTTNQVVHLSNQNFSTPQGDVDFSDLKMVVFTLTSSDGSTQQKNVSISELEFRQSLEAEFTQQETYAIPNPMTDNATIYFPATKSGSYQLTFYDQRGTKMYSYQGYAVQGINQVPIDANRWQRGLYYYQVVTNNIGYSGKVILTD